MAATHWHTFQILTKRPERMLSVVTGGKVAQLPNVWLGTSVERRDFKPRVGVLRRVPAAVRFLSLEPLLGPLDRLDLRGIQWVIVGGESGPRARPLRKEWVEEIRRQCEARNVPFFFKQWGGADKKKAGRLLNGRQWNHFPLAA